MADRPTIKIERAKLDEMSRDLNSNATVADAIALSMAIIHYFGMMDPYAMDDIAALVDFYSERFGGTIYEITDNEGTTSAEG